MKALEIQIGETFGRLTVLKKSKNGKGHAVWKCGGKKTVKYRTAFSGMASDREHGNHV